jgi:hypothetical protein
LTVSQYGPPAGIPLAPQEGVMVLYSPTSFDLVHLQAEALSKALRDIGVLAGNGAALGDPQQMPQSITIVIGPKPQK